MALTDSLISYWKLDEASGNAADAHGSNTLTDNNTAGVGTGIINNGRHFDGSSESLSIADNSDLSTGDIDFSIQMWMKADTINNDKTPLAKDGNLASSREYGFYFAGSVLYFYVFGPSSQFSQVGSGTLSTATWYHIVVWHDATANQIGIAVNDGTPSTTSHTAGVRDGNSAFTIGSRSDAAEFFDGIIDEVGFWKKVLSGSEITSLYNSGSGLAYPFTGGGGGATVRMLVNGGLVNAGLVNKGLVA